VIFDKRLRNVIKDTFDDQLQKKHVNEDLILSSMQWYCCLLHWWMSYITQNNFHGHPWRWDVSV